MTDEAIKIAIAECLGWTVINNVLCDPRPEVKHGKETGDIEMNPVAYVPDYVNDLNACHEMENHLITTTDNPERGNYLVYLAKLTNCQPTFATARQRCEAFLKVKGKWVELNAVVAKG